MKISLTMVLALLACLYSSACVIYHLSSHDLPEPLMLPLYPGIWVGFLVYDKIGEQFMLCYAAGIGAMTALGAVLGAIFDGLADSSGSATPPP